MHARYLGTRRAHFVWVGVHVVVCECVREGERERNIVRGMGAAATVSSSWRCKIVYGCGGSAGTAGSGLEQCGAGQGLTGPHPHPVKPDGRTAPVPTVTNTLRDTGALGTASNESHVCVKVHCTKTPSL